MHASRSSGAFDMNSDTSTTWWERAVLYHIYPRSYRDTTGNGIGDLPGIVEKLDYLQDLGVDGIWLSPIFPSPMTDFGYDVSDYTDVHPDFGSLADLDQLIEQAHQRDLRLLLDFVPNHSSDQHPWFLEAASSRENTKRDWYLWRDPAPDDGPPNNWLSYFGGSAWTYHESTGQYYLHSFLKEQPDLNWRNSEVVEAMHSVLRFWLDRGVDGFRVDAVMPVIKDEQFRDNPTRAEKRFGKDTGAAGQQLRVYSSNQPELHDLLRGFRSLVDQYEGERVLLGEVYTMDSATAAEYYGNNDEFQLVLNVTLVNHSWEAEGLRHYVEAFDNALPAGAQPVVVLGSHDEPRLASRWGEQQARVAAVMLLTLRGTPIIYYGDEIGMLNGELPTEGSLDPWPELAGLPELSRDVARTPMQWDATAGAGFTKSSTSPWLPIHARSGEINVATQQEDPRSLLSLYTKLLELRHASPALLHGRYQALEDQPEGTYVYRRELDRERYLIALNFSPVAQSLSNQSERSGHILISSYLDLKGEVDLTELSLRADEGLVIRLNG